MATKTADIHVRIQPGIKSQAEQIFGRTGFSASEAIEQFYIWTIRHQHTPMRLKKRAEIPDLNIMTETEIRKMLGDAKKQVREGNTYSNGEVKMMLREELSAKV